MAAVPLAEVGLDVRHIHILPILIRAADVKDKVSNARTEWLLASNLSYMYLRDPEERGREEENTEKKEESEGEGRRETRKGEGGREAGRGEESRVADQALP